MLAELTKAYREIADLKAQIARRPYYFYPSYPWGGWYGNTGTYVGSTTLGATSTQGANTSYSFAVSDSASIEDIRKGFNQVSGRGSATE